MVLAGRSGEGSEYGEGGGASHRGKCILCYAMPSTDRAYGATPSTERAYNAMSYSVLSERMVLCDTQY
eukprot:1532180-Rhodomonas_salina.3